jgi:hypothetical protein
MALLDRFRTQARHKHPDAAVRLAFVQEIPLDERELLAEIAREDADPRVRRSAVAKLMDPAALALIAQHETDEQVRAQAVGMLRDLALEAFEGAGEAESLAAIDALTDAKTIVGIAKNASRESTAQRALARVSDVHALGSLARHAEHESVRRAALDALQDHAEILSTALNSEFKDPTLAAVERISDRNELEQIVARAKNKSAAKRARAIVREMDERAASAAEAVAAAAAEAAQVAASEAAAAAAAKAAEPDPVEIERAARAEADRQARAHEEAERLRVEQEAAARRREAQESAARARLEAAQDAARKDAERRTARLTELADDATRAAALDDLAAARRQFAIIRKEWTGLCLASPADPELATRYAEAEAAFMARDAAAHEADQRARREALTRMQQIVARVEATAAQVDLSLKTGERGLKDIRTALGSIPQLPSKRDYEEIVRRLKASQTVLMPKVQELRDVADWQRWANVGIQEQLCEKMEALKAVDDPEEIAKQVRDLQQQWRQAADVPRAQGEALWNRFKAAHDEAWARCESHFAAQAEARGENLAKKVALCERAEALADSTNWIRTADEIKKLQAEWKTIGAVTRGQEKAVWERFRAACDRFFTRRHADLAERKTVWAENLVKKEALCVKVEALRDSIDWDAAANEIKRLQVEWKTIGPVKKTRSEAIWQRFRGACDIFFARYAQRHDIAKGERLAAREAICAELEALAGDNRESAVGSQEPAIGSQESLAESQQPAGDDPQSASINPQSAVGDPQSAIPDPQSAIPDPQSAIGDPQSAVSDPQSAVGDPQSAVGDPQSAFGDPQSAIANPQSAIRNPQSEAPPPDLMATVRSLRGRWQSELAARGVDRDRAIALDARFAAAFNRVIARWPAVFGGTDLDPDANRHRMETLVRRMEELAKSLAGPGLAGGTDAALSPTTRLAVMLKEALAANTIGGKVDDDSRFRAAYDEVRQAQVSWSRIGPVAEESRRALADRFQRAIRVISDRAGQAGRAGMAGGPGRAGR